MPTRIRILYLCFLTVIGAIILRLAYWQLFKGPSLRIEARDQYLESNVTTPDRGEIITADGYPLVGNSPVYSLGAYVPHLEESPEKIVDLVLPFLEFEITDPEVATDPARAAAKTRELSEQTRSTMLSRLSSQSYATLARGLSLTQKTDLGSLNLPGLSFEESFRRSYPEASMSAHITGFVGRDEVGVAQGYFGLEGYYNGELEGQQGVTLEEKDAGGNPLLVGDYFTRLAREGRTLKLHLERGVQYLVRDELERALTRYGAKSGEVIVMEPYTGAILAMVTLPTYDPRKFHLYDSGLYKNPAIADSYEPGSTFKVLVMAAALDSGRLDLDDHCNICAGPLPIDKYLIKTWNGEYHPEATPEQILVHSDNVGMVWISELLGGELMSDYLTRFGIGQKTGIDLEEEIAPPTRQNWGKIDYATASFGQGIAVTSIEMVRAVSAIANGGRLLQPRVVKEVIGETTVPVLPKDEGRILSEDTAAKMTELMISAADHGEAKWTRLPNYTVAGKTGTAQIPVSGHYDEEKTIASFVGFAPAKKPRFVMLVKLEEPTSSPWGSETAAPLWFTLARRLLLHYNIPPDN